MEVVRRKNTRGGTFIAGIVFILVGLAVNPMLKNIKAEAEASENWPAAQGVISTSEILSFKSHNSDGKETTQYRENIIALYEVDGKEHTSDGLNIMSGHSSTSSRSSVKKKTQAYPVGSEVTVYYDPDDITYAVLEPGLPLLLRTLFFLPWISVIVGILIIGGGILRLVKLAAAVGVMANAGGTEQPAPRAEPVPAATPEEKKTVPDRGEGDDDGFSL